MFGKKFLGMDLLAVMLISQAVPKARATTYCDQAQFVSDLTAPDGSSFAPGAGFTKTWRLVNVGTCTWNTSYTLVWAGGDSLAAPVSVNLPVDVPPGQMVDISVNLSAPATAGGVGAQGHARQDRDRALLRIGRSTAVRRASDRD